MANDILQEVECQLTAEQWTRTPISEFTIGNFKDFDQLLDQIFDAGKQNAAKELCEHFLEQNKNSVIALYLCGIMALHRQQIDDAYVLSVIDLFYKHKRWGLCWHLCQRALNFGENAVVLRILAECCEQQNQEEELYNIWTRLVKVDYQEANIVMTLARHREEQGDAALALDFYHKAINRYINNRKVKPITEAWEALIRLDLDHIDTFGQISRKIAAIAPLQAIDNLSTLHEAYRAAENKKHVIVVLKWILELEPNDMRFRKILVQAYRDLYSDHSRLEDYIKSSNLDQSWRNVAEAISDFEKHISYDVGNFVYHKNWGVGRIREIKNDSMIIDFSKKRGHKLSVKMAIEALQSLSKEHIWVLKSAVSREKLHRRVKNDPAWALRTIIQSFNNQADIKKIKGELVSHVLTEGEWSTWSKNARKMLKEDASFGVHPELPNVFIVREKPMSHGEKLANSFSGENDFFKRLKIAQEYLASNDADTDYFLEMFRYFASNLKIQNINEQYVASYLYIKQLQKDYPFLIIETETPTFDEIYSQLEKPSEIYARINNQELQHYFLRSLQEKVSSWPDEMAKMFPIAPSEMIIDLLLDNDQFEQLREIVINIVAHFREMRMAFVWLMQNTRKKTWFENCRIPGEQLVVCMLRLFDLSARDISSRKDAQENRKSLRVLHKILIKEDYLLQFIGSDDCNITFATRIYALLKEIDRMDKDITKLEASWFQDTYQILIVRFPKLDQDIADSNTPDIISSAGQFILVTQNGLDRQREELRHILEVEIPRNSKEIGAAIELGDLSENAEYKAGKETQEALNIQVGKLRSEIDKAKVFDPRDTNLSEVGFGTKVTLLNMDRSEEEGFSILGPWESDPDKGVISYLSPFGNNLLGAKKNEEISFEINERKSHYKVLSVEKAEF
ncbi:transcription elongation factor GreA [Candidatus Haliotispira prima]|uniref:Transcription elongation factor GreA n=1 Tax=Candidatus Haliotispira prima TaxID=3034016 RepID=A0ABY8MK39_9SPIO|nr:transcription elongation factor GreA [Candidatus Haliotispira prima]